MASWKEEAGSYDLMFTLDDGTQERARHRFLALCCGGFSQAKIPKAPGLWSYKGEVFHSADWPETLEAESLRGKEVMVVGNGCSGSVRTCVSRAPSLEAVPRSSGLWRRIPISK